MTFEALRRVLPNGLLLISCWIIAPTAAPAQEWQHLTPRERYDTMQKYREYENLPPKRKQDIDKRYKRWRNLDDAKRKQVLRNYRRYQKMPPAERQRFEQQYDRWRQDRRSRREPSPDARNTDRNSNRSDGKKKKRQ